MTQKMWRDDTTSPELDSLITRIFEWRNMLYGSHAYLTPAEYKAQSESWVRASLPTGDPRFD